MAVAAEPRHERARRLHRLQQLLARLRPRTVWLADSVVAAAAAAAGAGGERGAGPSSTPSAANTLLVEAVLALQILLDPRQDTGPTPPPG